MSDSQTAQWTELLLGSQVSERLSSLKNAVFEGISRRHPPPEGPGSADSEDWGAIQAQRPWRLAARVVAGLMALFLSAWWIGTRGVTPRQSDLDAIAVKAPRIPQPFQPTEVVSPAVLLGIDFAKVHRELFPAWIMAMQREPFTVGYPEAERTFFLLRAEAGKDPNLSALLTELNDKMMDNIPGFAADIHLLFKGWNDYLERNSLPWRIEHHIENTPKGPRVYALSYHVLGDLRIDTNGEPNRVLLLARADRTNLVESYFGQTAIEHEGALIVADRIAEYSTQQLWPMFGTHGPLTDLQRAFSSAVRQEARGVLPREVIDELGSAADLHDSLSDAVHALGARRGCGRTVVIEGVPWSGLSERALSMVRRAADRNSKGRCKRLTSTDAQFLETTSNRLAGDSALEQSLGQLAGWLARAVVVHEVRHVADERHAEAGARTPACARCPESLGPNERAELRAYLAAFGTEGLGYVSLMQACGTGGHGPGPSGAALSFALARLMPGGCDAAPPSDLYARAKQMEIELFGSSEPIELPATFPTTIPVH
ncbi:MAG: hypothetical protein HY898_32920 [Deltaproteobacteria bacterium]|nr:hypothetical protein [Deltaproteobacteria bacterium]